MNRMQSLYLLVTSVTFIAVIVMLFFAATDSKNRLGFLGVAVFFVLVGAFWIYRLVKG